MNLGPTISQSADRAIGLMNAMLCDITPDRFARFSTGSNGLIQSNHPAFVYGHLSLYTSRLIDMAGGDGSQHAAPAEWNALFSKNATCQDDPSGTIYPAMNLLTETCLNGYQAAAKTIATADNDRLSQPTPNEQMRSTFPTLAIACNFILNSHVMFHLGQVSAWRRAEGLSSAI